MSRPLLTVILAAGKGTRMRSQLPKVLHRIAGRSMLGHVLALAGSVGGDKLAVVVGPGMDDVRKEALAAAPGATVFVQENQRGTADAVLAAREAIAAHAGDLLVLFADTPLITPETVGKLRAELDHGAQVAVLGFEAREPGSYGRLLTEADGALTAIREAKDASAAELQVRLCNSGVMAFRLDRPLDVLRSIGNANAKGEFYLTDAIEIVRKGGGRAAVVVCEEDEVLGVKIGRAHV
jgi:bifunctional UDP-N-acetylglucosamine pyrophosphorylase/glucosamine-1-phosphate N-acetyltransferase